MASKLAVKGPGELAVGSRVLTGTGFTKKGEIKFIGSTKFSTGEWIGVLLDTADGKNDGSVGDTRYFDAEPNYGLFVKRAQVKPDTAKVRVPSTATASGTSSPASSVKSTASSNAPGAPARATAARVSLAAPASPRVSSAAAAPRTSTAAAPSSRPSIGTSSSSTATPALNSPRAAATGRKSISSSSNSSGSEAPRSIKGGGRGVTALTTSDSSNSLETAAKTSSPAASSSGSKLMNPIRNFKSRAEGGGTSADRLSEKLAHAPISTAAAAVVVVPSTPVTSSSASAASRSRVGDIGSPIARAEAAMATAAATTAAASISSGVPVNTPTTAAASAAAARSFSTPIAAVAASNTAATAAENESAAAAVVVDYQNTINQLQQEKQQLQVKVRMLETKLADSADVDAQQHQTSVNALELEEKIAVLEAENSRLLEEQEQLSLALMNANELTIHAEERAAEANAAVDVANATIASNADVIAAANATASSSRITAAAAAAESDVESRQYVLNEQLEDLQLQVDSLKLDKEAIQLDMEMLQEQYEQWKTEIDEAIEDMDIMSSVTTTAAATAVASDAVDSNAEDIEGTSAAAAKIFQLREENEKFREALRRLNHVSIQDKSSLHSLHIKANALEDEVLALRSYKQQSESDISELRQCVDAAHEAGAMSEALALQNLHLQEQLQQAQEAIHELEETIELNEEIDQQQRSQIDADAQVIEMLNSSIDAYEDVVGQKEQELANQFKTIDKLRVVNKTLKHEIHRLNVLRATASAESQHVESRLQELASLRSRQAVVLQDMSSLYEESVLVTVQKYKFQAMHSRFEAIFGATSLYKEESLLLSSEITYLTCLSSGFEAARGVSAALDLALEQEGRVWVITTVATPTTSTAVATATAADDANAVMFPRVPVMAAALGRLYLLLLHAVSATVESNLHLYIDTDATTTAATAMGGSTSSSSSSGGAMGHQAQAAQVMLRLKSLFERIAKLGGQAQQLCTELQKDAQLKNEEAEDMGLEVLEDEQDDDEDAASGEVDDDDSGNGSGGLNEMGQKTAVAAAGAHFDATGNKIGALVVHGAKTTSRINDLLTAVDECTEQLLKLSNNSRRSNSATTAAVATDAVLLLGNFDLMQPPVPTSTAAAAAAAVDSGIDRFPILTVETHFLSLTTLCNMALHQTEAKKFAAATTTAAAAATSRGSGDLSSLLRSIKVDLKTGLYNLKSNQGHYSHQTNELADIFKTLVSCFQQQQEKVRVVSSSESTNESNDSADETSTASVGNAINTLMFQCSEEQTFLTVKSLMDRIRKVNNSPGVMSHANSSSIVSLGLTVVMRYYPMLFATAVSTAADPHQMSGLREQFRQLLEKYWGLTSKGTNDLLAATYTASSASSQMRSLSAASTDSYSAGDNSSSSSGMGGTSIDLAWKLRTDQCREIVREKLGEKDTSSSVARNKGSNAEAVAEITLQLQQITKELDEKRDELRSAVGRCRELQSQVDTLAGRGSSGVLKRKSSVVDAVTAKLLTAVDGNSSTALQISSEELLDLKNEVATLEAALETTEKRAEELGHENKQLKQQLQHPHSDSSSEVLPLAPGLGSFSGSITSSPLVRNVSSKNIRRQSLMNIAEAINAEVSAAAAATSPPPMLISTASSSSSSLLMQLFDEATSVTSPGKSPTPLPRYASRKSSFSLSNAAAVALAQAAQASTAAGAAATISAMDEQHTQLLIAELMHWKVMALRRLTASLLPLDIPPQLQRIYEELGSSAFMSGQEIDLEVGAMYAATSAAADFTALSRATEAAVLSTFIGDATPTLNATAAAAVEADSKLPSVGRSGLCIGEFKHIEFLSSPIDVNMEAYDLNGAPATVKASTYAALYHRLRLARAANIRIKQLPAVAATAVDSSSSAVSAAEVSTSSSGESSAGAKQQQRRAQEKSLREKLRARTNLIYRIPSLV